jgi:hypothetical protein
MAGQSVEVRDANPVPLDLDEDMSFQERTWTIQRIGWWVMALVVLAALAGLFATGPLSRAETSDPAGVLRVEYGRFLRSMAPSTLRLHVGKPLTPFDNAVPIRVSGPLAKAIKPEAITPEPIHAKAMSSGVEYVFALAEPGKAASIRFDFVTEGIGPIHAEIGIAGREPARISMFIYP